MDMRTERTKRNIVNAFVELRAKKPIEKITVKELTNLACINKATFYRHYKDIYDLSEDIENELIDNCLAEISNPEDFFSREFYYKLAIAFSSQGKLFDIIFSGTRKDMAAHKIHNVLCDRIYAKYPGFKDDKEKCIVLSAVIYGCFHAFRLYKNENFDTLIKSLSKTAELFEMQI